MTTHTCADAGPCSMSDTDSLDLNKPAPDEEVLISVIIPCFNQGRFLNDAIQSVLEQNWRHIEIVVVNDGSTDDTKKVTENLGGVILIHQSHRGLSAARNTGLKASRGKYIVFLDADDMLLPGALTVGVQALTRHPEWAFVSGALNYVDVDGRPVGRMATPDYQGSDQYEALLSGTEAIVAPATVLYRREVLDDIGGFDPALSACADLDLYLRIAHKYPTGNHQTMVAQYRRHDANMSRDVRLMMAETVEVLRRHRPATGTDDHVGAAWRAGMRCCRNDYGPALLRQSLGHLLSPGARGADLIGLLTALTQAPMPIFKSSFRLVSRIAYRAAIRVLRRWRT